MTLLQFVKYLKTSGQKGMVYLDTVKNDPIIEFGTCVWPTLTDYCEGMERRNIIINAVENKSDFVIYNISLQTKRPSLIKRLLDYIL